MAKSEYLQREQAAKKQLGAKGVKKRVKQLPTAARAFTREMTGIDVSRKGVKVDPFAVAMALPVGKLVKAASVLRAAGKSSQVAPLVARVAAKAIGGSTKAEKALEQLGLELRGESAARIFATANRSRVLENAPKAWKKITGKKGEITRGSAARDSAESLFPKLPSRGGDAPSLLRGSRDIRTFDRYADPINEGAGRFKGRDDLNDFVSDMGKLGKFRKVGKAAAAAKKRGGR